MRIFSSMLNYHPHLFAVENKSVQRIQTPIKPDFCWMDWSFENSVMDLGEIKHPGPPPIMQQDPGLTESAKEEFHDNVVVPLCVKVHLYPRAEFCNL